MGMKIRALQSYVKLLRSFGRVVAADVVLVVGVTVLALLTH